MKTQEPALRLRIIVGENDKMGHRPLYEAIVLKAREAGLGGATVTRGVMGYGRRSKLHTAKILRLSEDMPMIVEIVDRRDRIESFLTNLSNVEGISIDGLVTLEEVQLLT